MPIRYSSHNRQSMATSTPTLNHSPIQGLLYIEITSRHRTNQQDRVSRLKTCMSCHYLNTFFGRYFPTNCNYLKVKLYIYLTNYELLSILGEQTSILMDTFWFRKALTSLSSTASQPHSSRHNPPVRTQSGLGHGGTSGGSRRTCF